MQTAGVTIVPDGDFAAMLRVPAGLAADTVFNVGTGITAPRMYNATATVTVVAPGEGEFPLTFVGFVDAGNIGVTTQAVVIGVPASISVSPPTGASVEWFVGPNSVGTEASLPIDASVHNNRTGPLHVTMVLTLADGRRYSRVVTITVNLN